MTMISNEETQQPIVATSTYWHMKQNAFIDIQSTLSLW